MTSPHQLDALDRLRKIGGAKLVSDMATLFRSESARRFADVSRAFADGDAPALANAAHALKASSAQLGATRLASIAAQAEQAAAAGDVAGAKLAFGEMEIALREWNDWITGVLDAEPAA